MKFSQRQGITPSTKNIQLEYIDDELRNLLWNGAKIFVLDKLSMRATHSGPAPFYYLCMRLWQKHFKRPIDSIPSLDDALEEMREIFLSDDWYVVYDLLEFLAALETIDFDADIDGLKAYSNRILEQEFSAYRFVGSEITPITNPHEIKAIDDALDTSSSLTSLRGVNVHLRSALEKLSDRKSPDYRNSIKESISAIESIAKVISDNPKDTLGGALDKIKGKIKLHPSLERGFKQIYGYTSDSDGIRHGLMDDPNCDFDDAKYMLVSCSAFINYLIMKSKKSGIVFS